MKKNIFLTIGFVILTFFGFFALAVNRGVTEKGILIGVTTALTGPYSIQPSRQLEGTKIYFDKINKSGGINGRQLTLLAYDDRNDLSLAFEYAQKLAVYDKVFLFYNLPATMSIKSLLPLVADKDIPIIASSSRDSFFCDPPNRNIFNIRPSFRDESETIINFLSSKRIKNISILYQDDAFGQGGQLNLSKAISKRKLTVKEVASYDRNSLDINQAYISIKKSNPDAIVLWSLGKIGIQFIRLAIKENWNPIFFLELNQLNAEMIEASKDWTAQVFVALNLPPAETSKLEIAQQYVADSAAVKMEIEPNRFEGYVNAAVLVASLKLAGKELSRKSLRLALNEKMRNLNIGGLKCEFSTKSRQAFSKSFVAQLVKGKMSIEPAKVKK